MTTRPHLVQQALSPNSATPNSVIDLWGSIKFKLPERPTSGLLLFGLNKHLYKTGFFKLFFGDASTHSLLKETMKLDRLVVIILENNQNCI